MGLRARAAAIIRPVLRVRRSKIIGRNNLLPVAALQACDEYVRNGCPKCGHRPL